MKLTPQFFEVIKNFSTITDGMVFVPGRIQTAITKHGNTTTYFAKGDVEIEIEQQFGIGNLAKFLSVLSLLKNPEITIDGQHLVAISEDQSIATQLALTNPDFIKWEPKPEKYNNIQTPIEFNMPWSSYISISKLYGVLGSSHYIFQGDGEKVILSVLAGSKNQSEGISTDLASIDLGSCSESFKATILGERLKLLTNRDYKIRISRKGAFCLESDIVYYCLPVESKMSEL